MPPDLAKKEDLVVFGFFLDSQEYSRNKILIQNLRELNWNPKMCTINLGFIRSSTSPKIKIISTLIFAPIRWFFLCLKYWIIPDHKIIYVPYPSHIDAWLACLFARWTNRKVIIDAFLGLYDTIIRDRKLFNERSLIARLIWHYEKSILRFADLALVDTEEHVTMLERDFNLPKSRVVHLPVGIDETLWQKAPYPTTNQIFRIIFWSTFIPLHGVEIIARAAKELENESNIRFLIIGAGQLREEFRNLLGNLSLSNLKWIDQFIPLHEIQQYVVKSHCCLGIFGQEEKTQRVIPYKIYQALASARPLITARTRIAEQLFSDKVNALLVEPGNYKELANSIRLLSKDRQLAINIGKKGRELYENKLSNRVIKDKLRQILQSVHNSQDKIQGQ